MAKEQISAQTHSLLYFPTVCHSYACSLLRCSRNSITSSSSFFFFFSSFWTGSSAVILSCNRNHTTGINWAVIAEALGTWTMLNCVHCAGTMTHNFWFIFSSNFFLLIPSVLLSHTSISLPFSSVCVTMCVHLKFIQSSLTVHLLSTLWVHFNFQMKHGSKCLLCICFGIKNIIWNY